MSLRIERLASGGWLWRVNTICRGIEKTLDEACWSLAEYVKGIRHEDSVCAELRNQERAARLLRYLHRYDEWCAEVPTTSFLLARLSREDLGHLTAGRPTEVSAEFAFWVHGVDGKPTEYIEWRIHRAPDGEMWPLFFRGDWNFRPSYGRYKWTLAYVPKVAGPTMKTKEGE